MNDLEKAVELLTEQEYTCVLCREDRVFTSRERGVKPLLCFLQSGEDFRGYAAADKVVGKATAFLYVLLGVKQVWTPVASEGAAGVLERYGVKLRCEQMVPAIFNRRRDGFCPMETATKSIEDPAEALDAIRETLKKLAAQ